MPSGVSTPQRPVTKADAHRPETADFLQMKRGMAGIALQEIEAPIGDRPSRRGE
jgi:hypothetical protein